MWVYLVAGVLLGLIPGMIARNKGHSFIAWWAYGIVFFIPALPHALLLKPDIEAVNHTKGRKGLKKCPFCAEWILRNATNCSYCGKNLTSLTKAYDDGWHEPDFHKDQQGTEANVLRPPSERGP